MEDILRYPIGKYAPKDSHTKNEIDAYINRIESLPSKLEKATQGLSEEQLDTPYREDGWTVRQVVHHIADSHMNAYIRIKWMLTEETPIIKAYAEKLWAQTPETKADLSLSMPLIKSLHAKWVVLLRQVTEEDLKRQFFHPDTKKLVRMDNLLGTYAWHGEHHLAHITSLKDRKGW